MNEQAYQAVRKYINEEFEKRRRSIPTNQFAAEKAKKDGALKWLEVLKRTGQEPQTQLINQP